MFYRPKPEHSDLETDAILIGTTEHILDRRCRSKESWYTPTTPEGDTDTEEALRAEVVELQPVYKWGS
jgi:hypothetical protein